MLHADVGDVTEARVAFKAGLQQDRLELGLWQCWGTLESQQGNFEGARELFRTGAEANPDHPKLAILWHVRPSTCMRVCPCCASTLCDEATCGNPLPCACFRFPRGALPGIKLSNVYICRRGQ